MKKIRQIISWVVFGVQASIGLTIVLLQFDNSVLGNRIFGPDVEETVVATSTDQPVALSGVQNFVINAMDVEYRIQKQLDGSASMDVTEVIEAQFPNFNQNRGILRAIPKSYRGISLRLGNIAVTDAAGERPLTFSTYTENGNLVLKIGDPNMYVRGKQVYRISYTVHDVIRFDDGADTLAWNINGDQWPQPFGRVSATFFVPASLEPALLSDQVCDSSVPVRSPLACTVSREKTDGIVRISATQLEVPQRSTLFVAFGFTKGTFSLSEAAQRAALVRRVVPYVAGALAIIGYVVVPLMTLRYVRRRWRESGRDAKPDMPHPPQYQPPAGISVVTAAAVLHEKPTNGSISAGLLELAIKGYIRIIEREKDKLIGKSKEYDIELLRDLTDAEPGLRAVADVFFGKHPAVGSKVALKYSYEYANRVASFTTTIAEHVTSQGYFVTNPLKAGRRLIYIGIALLVVGILMTFITLGVFGGVALAGVIMIVGGTKMPARTASGVDLKEYVEGIKDYVSMSESERLEFHQGLETAGRKVLQGQSALTLYEPLLPYALLFGKLKSWNKLLDPLYVDKSPAWYYTNSAWVAGSSFSSHLNGALSATTVSFTAPSSSGGGGGGGGFSGGGGGGGGGGW